VSFATNEQGETLGSFGSYEEIESWSYGVSGVKLVESVLWAGRPDPPALSRFADISFGHTHKSYVVDLAPSWVSAEGHAGRATGKNHDRGLLARITPYNSINAPSLFPALDPRFEPLGGLRLDVSHGRSRINSGRDHLVYGDDQVDTVLELERTGWAVRVSTGLPPSVREIEPEWLMDILLGGKPALVSVAVAWDEVSTEWPAHAWYPTAAKRRGLEVEFAELIALRVGYVKEDGDIDGNTYGIGLALPLGRLGRVRVDWAQVPQATLLVDVNRWAASIHLHPLAGYQAILGRD
jgi:hypothetical protein